MTDAVVARILAEWSSGRIAMVELAQEIIADADRFSPALLRSALSADAYRQICELFVGYGGWLDAIDEARVRPAAVIAARSWAPQLLRDLEEMKRPKG